jgi:SM-20-related protein
VGPSIQYGQIQQFDDALPADLYADLVQGSRRLRWRFGWNTPSNPTAQYWHHEVGYGDKNNDKDVSARVEEHPVKAFHAYQAWLRSALVPADTKILRFYLNAHTYGTDGWPHTDADRENELTTVLYLVPSWKPEWAGETVVFDDEGDIDAAVMPRPNRLLTFPSNRLHAPRPLTKEYGGLRVVLVVKLASSRGPEGFYR